MNKNITSRWWFFLGLLIIFFIPPVAEVSFDSRNTNSVIFEVLQYPFIYKFDMLYSIIKVIFLVMITLLILNKFNVHKIFNYFVVIVLIGVALFQNSSNTASYGMTVLLGNLILNVIVAILWLYQIHKTQANALRDSIGYNKYWLIGLALLAYWFPVDMTGKHPNFVITELLFNESMVTFCMIIPVILVVTILYFNKINLITLKVTGFIGILFGLVNMVTWFIMVKEMWWMGILHIPLLVISFYVFVLSRKALKKER